IICLLMLVLIIEAPRAFSLKMDRTARIARGIAALGALVGTLLPLFRGVAAAMVACWGIAWLGARRAKASGAQQGSSRGSSRAGILLLVPVLAFAAWSAGLLDLSRLSSRLTNPRNVLVRIAAWSDSAKALASHPIAGVGLGNYQSYFYANNNKDADTVASDF